MGWVELGCLVSLWFAIGSSSSDSVVDSGWPFGAAGLFAGRWAAVSEVGFWSHQRFRREKAIIPETRGHTGVPRSSMSLLTGMGQSTSTGSTGAILSGVISAVETTGANSLFSNESFG